MKFIYKASINVPKNGAYSISYGKLPAPKAPADPFDQALALREQGQPEKAGAICDQILSVDPQDFNALHMKGVIAFERGDWDGCIHFIGKALGVNPNVADAQNNLGNAFKSKDQKENAVMCYENAITLDPGHAEARNSLGVMLYLQNKYEESLVSLDEAIRLQPLLAEAYCNRANTRDAMRDLDGALADYRKAYSLNQNLDTLTESLLFLENAICDWPRTPAMLDGLRLALQARAVKTTVPWRILSLMDDPYLHRIAAEIKAPKSSSSASVATANPQSRRDRKIRVGYFSGDFREHPVGYLVAELFELHNKDLFEIIAFTSDESNASAIRRRIETAFDKVVDLHNKPELDTVALCLAENLDIAVDMMGHTQGSLAQLFSHRVAPVQINYLGYPGTMGAPYYDYIVADPFIIPSESQRYFSEKVAYLPDTFFVNDRKRAVAERIFTREELGLPPTGVVYCCFNNAYKITKESFMRWLSILRKVEGSVLWLSDMHSTAVKNLKNFAKAENIDSARLIFAPRMESHSEHLARYRYADLFLDTSPYNAHTTTSDALWVGLPVLTLVGRAFAGRVAGSMLKSIGMPELVVETEASYIDLAVQLGNNPTQLQELRTRLAHNRDTTALFDTPRFVHNLEALYQRMYERSLAGNPPEHLWL
jgi:predicted O-linked N-acetylglucosamine transferase (SPINDLY family)